MAYNYKSILVAVDGSKSAEYAFKKAIHIAQRNNAKITLVHVIDARSFATIDSFNGTLAERANTYAENLLSGYVKEAQNLGFGAIDTIIEYGSPRVAIPKQVAKKVEADLIVCGATGLNVVERLLIGSVSEQITRSANCDVLVVRNAENEDLEENN